MISAFYSFLSFIFTLGLSTIANYQNNSTMSLLNASGRQGVRTMSSLCRRLQGKVAVVTASTDGIGYSIAERLLDEGASVVVSSRKADNVAKAVEKLTSRGHVTGVVCHVGKRDDRIALLKTAEDKFGGIDILVSNAAVNPTVGGVTETSDEAWDKIFDINVKCAFTLTKEVKPYLARRGGGSIVYVSSIAGFVPQQILGAYSVSKTALLGLTKACAEELATENVRVNCVAPGIIKTNFSSALTTNEMVTEPLLMTVAMRRLFLEMENMDRIYRSNFEKELRYYLQDYYLLDYLQELRYLVTEGEIL